MDSASSTRAVIHTAPYEHPGLKCGARPECTFTSAVRNTQVPASVATHRSLCPQRPSRTGEARGRLPRTRQGGRRSGHCLLDDSNSIISSWGKSRRSGHPNERQWKSRRRLQRGAEATAAARPQAQAKQGRTSHHGRDQRTPLGASQPSHLRVAQRDRELAAGRRPRPHVRTLSTGCPRGRGGSGEHTAAQIQEKVNGGHPRHVSPREAEATVADAAAGLTRGSCSSSPRAFFREPGGGRAELSRCIARLEASPTNQESMATRQTRKASETSPACMGFCRGVARHDGRQAALGPWRVLRRLQRTVSGFPRSQQISLFYKTAPKSA